MQLPYLHLFSLPIIAAVIGWATNYLAVKMIFRPRTPVRVLGMQIQGLVPRRQKELARSIAETVEAKLISHKDVVAHLQNPQVHAELKAQVEQLIDKFINERLATQPAIGMFLQGPVGQMIRGMLVEQFEAALPNILETLQAQLEEHVDFRQIVQKKVEEFDLGTLEGIIYQISARELKAIELLGGVLGFIVGLLQVGLFLLQ